MDGTLLDSERLSQQAWDSAAREHGYSINMSLFLQMVGHRTPDIADILKTALGKDVPAEAIASAAAQKYLQVTEINVPVMPGAEEILRFCKNKKLKIGIATSTRRAYALKKLERAKLLPYIDAMTCGNEVSRGKPHPEIYRRTAQALDCQPDKCYAVEDSPTGFKAAFDAGCKTFLIPDLVPPDKSTLQNAHKILKNLNELKEWI